MNKDRAPYEGVIELYEIENVVVVGTNTIANGFGRMRKSTMCLANKYMPELMQIGVVRKRTYKTAKNQIAYEYLLTKDQASFFIALMRNNKGTVQFNLALILKFVAAYDAFRSNSTKAISLNDFITKVT